MRDVSLTAGPVVYSYEIEGMCLFKYDGDLLEAAEFFVEISPDDPHDFACQIITKNQLSIVYRSNEYGNWPIIARRLFEKHTEALRRSKAYA